MQFLFNIILRSAAPARRQRGAGKAALQQIARKQQVGYTVRFTLHRIHSHCTKKHLRYMVEKQTNTTSTYWEQTEDLPSRSWRALKWRRWRGCHTRIWFWMNERGPLCSSEQTKTQAERNCTEKERERQRRVRRGETALRSVKSLMWMPLNGISVML